MPLVDILLATYNGAKYLPEQLASLEAQTHADWRLIVRDDGSGDGSLGLVRDWAAETGRDLIVLEDSDTRLGPAQSFGRLLARSDAPYFAFCDQDDVWGSRKIERLLQVADGYKGHVLLVHCDLAVVDEQLRTLVPSLWKMRRNTSEVRRAALGYRASLVFQNQITGCAALGNAALREAMIPLPPGISMHDWWAGLCASFRGKILEVEEPLVLYRQHRNNALGAQSRSFKVLASRLLFSPRKTVHQTRIDYRNRARQALTALTALSDVMADDEQRFVKDFASLENGLRTVCGRRLFRWSLEERKRWPLAFVLISETFASSKQKKDT